MTPGWWWLAACAPQEGVLAEIEVYVPPLGEAQDYDQDGLRDADEDWLGTRLDDPDTDVDGISDGDELLLGTDPTLPDTDGDGVDDDEELILELDPTSADSDGGGAPDGAEIIDGTAPDDPRDDIVLGAFIGGGGCRTGLPSALPGFAGSIGLLAWVAGLFLAARRAR